MKLLRLVDVFALYRFVFFVSLVCLANADSIVSNGEHISIQIDTKTPNLLYNGIRSTFITIKNNETIRITCTKINESKNGTLSAFVSTMQAKPVKCLAYSVSNTTDDFYCTKKVFEYKLFSVRSFSNYQVVCRLVESNQIARKVILRLYDDSLPRIRSGFQLDNIGATVTHYLQNEVIGCEAIQRTDLPILVDSIGWFTHDLVYLGFAFNKLPMSKNIINYTSNFDASSKFVRDNTIYKCCTMLNSIIVNCQQFLAVGNSTTRATARLPVSIAKQMNAATVSSILEERASASSSSSLSATEIGIIIACVAGTVILTLLAILCLLCYKRHRYGAVCLHSRGSISRSFDVNQFDSPQAVYDFRKSNQQFKLNTAFDNQEYVDTLSLNNKNLINPSSSSSSSSSPNRLVSYSPNNYSFISPITAHATFRVQANSCRINDNFSETSILHAVQPPLSPITTLSSRIQKQTLSNFSFPPPPHQLLNDIPEITNNFDGDYVLDNTYDNNSNFISIINVSLNEDLSQSQPVGSKRQTSVLY